jgi:hypothetical protein
MRLSIAYFAAHPRLPNAYTTFSFNHVRLTLLKYLQDWLRMSIQDLIFDKVPSSTFSFYQHPPDLA